ncbi:integrase [Burkholderia multivorans]|uniref:tyrosine-type recombinase/integrase n=1 Tax=Burkholderia multivorans TaxID=87883 RepID=UPI000CFF9704|nr:tyrosine-type recombinase/integrase [Burkholderia multivorans]MBU9639508.1 tyrosine-type recombinase/integrase [Burkholderia multivorans]PRF02833.1 integrase [Burkholderia multivorans]
MSFADWIDIGATPPQRLPGEADAVTAYLTDTLGHVVYTRWTLATVKQRYPSLAEAKAAKPAVMRLLLDQSTAVEYWDRGRARAVPATEAPAPETIVERVLRAHARRFKRDPGDVSTSTIGEGKQESLLVAGLSGTLLQWVARAGRYANPGSATNTLGVGDDAQAIVLFLRDRGSRSTHTTRAYVTEICRLAAWCIAHELGPFSDLTRHDLLAYRRALHHPARDVNEDDARSLTAASQARALAVVASLFRYWTETGYLTANPAAGLVRGQRRHVGLASSRILTAAQLAACDAKVNEVMADIDPVVAARRRAIWMLYRYAGVRLVELVWSDDQKLPVAEVESDGRWTLHVYGKGQKTRAIPLPQGCVSVLQAYRQLRGLPAHPESGERVALIHGLKGGSLQSSGLYDEVKAIFVAAAATLEYTDPGGAATLRRASPHWLRHAYARTLVVDRQVPLPAAQALLGHASIQTTAAYAKTDLSQLRAFVDRAFSSD